jgi:hypothetical protein
VSVPARRQQVAYGRERGLSARRVCTLLSVARSALSYQDLKKIGQSLVANETHEPAIQGESMPAKKRSHGELIAHSDFPEHHFVGGRLGGRGPYWRCGGRFHENTPL